MSDMLFQGRYIVLLMGIFSMYTGLIYNDIFSFAMQIFATGWDFSPVPGVNNSYVAEFNGLIYPIGVDPSWHGADNALIFTNSYKMKMSVIFGVMQVRLAGHRTGWGRPAPRPHQPLTLCAFAQHCGDRQMTFGLVLLLMNRVYKKDWVSVINEFIPQFIFLEARFFSGAPGHLKPCRTVADRRIPHAAWPCRRPQAIFGYLSIMIIYKWCTDWTGLIAPSLLDMLINMFLSPGVVDTPLYPGQVRATP